MEFRPEEIDTKMPLRERLKKAHENKMTLPFPKEKEKIICGRNGRTCDAAYYGDEWGVDCPAARQANCQYGVLYPQTIQWVVHRNM